MARRSGKAKRHPTADAPARRVPLPLYPTYNLQLVRIFIGPSIAENRHLADEDPGYHQSLGEEYQQAGVLEMRTARLSPLSRDVRPTAQHHGEAPGWSVAGRMRCTSCFTVGTKPLARRVAGEAVDIVAGEHQLVLDSPAVARSPAASSGCRRARVGLLAGGVVARSASSWELAVAQAAHAVGLVARISRAFSGATKISVCPACASAG